MTSEKILIENNIKRTEGRTIVLNVLSKSKYLITAADIQKEYKKIDRITLYRTLQLFVQQQLIERVADSNGTVYYGMKKNSEDVTIYFKCINCNKVEAMTKIVLDKFKRKYVPEEYNFLVKGTCKGC